MEIIKKIKTLILMLIVFVAFQACKKESSDASMGERPVVTAYLVVGEPISISVNQQKDLLDTASHGVPISGLSIVLSNGTNQITLTEISAGEYTSTDTTFVKENSTCSMSFNYNGKTVSASSKVPSHPLNFTASALSQAVPDFNPDSTNTFYPVTFNWTSAKNANYLLVFKNQEKYPNRISSGFGMRRGYEDIEEYLGAVATFQTQRMTFDFSGYYTTNLYSVNEEYNTILSSSSSSSLNLTNPETNVNNGLGIFTTMNKSSLVLYVYKQ